MRRLPGFFDSQETYSKLDGLGGPLVKIVDLALSRGPAGSRGV